MTYCGDEIKNIIITIGSIIRDIEDDDCYFEGEVITNRVGWSVREQLTYRVDKVVWNGDIILDDEFIGQIVPLQWYWLYINIIETRDKKLKELGL